MRDQYNKNKNKANTTTKATENNTKHTNNIYITNKTKHKNTKHK